MRLFLSLIALLTLLTSAWAGGYNIEGFLKKNKEIQRKVEMEHFNFMIGVCGANKRCAASAYSFAQNLFLGGQFQLGSPCIFSPIAATHTYNTLIHLQNPLLQVDLAFSADFLQGVFGIPSYRSRAECAYMWNADREAILMDPRKRNNLLLSAVAAVLSLEPEFLVRNVSVPFLGTVAQQALVILRKHGIRLSTNVGLVQRFLVWEGIRTIIRGTKAHKLPQGVTTDNAIMIGILTSAYWDLYKPSVLRREMSKFLLNVARRR